MICCQRYFKLCLISVLWAIINYYTFYQQKFIQEIRSQNPSIFWSSVTESRNLSKQNLLLSLFIPHFRLQKQLTPCTKYLNMVETKNSKMLQFFMTQESTVPMTIIGFRKNVWNDCETNTLQDIYLTLFCLIFVAL